MLHLFATDSVAEYAITTGMVGGIIAVFTAAIYKVVKLMWDDNKSRLDAQEVRHAREVDRLCKGHLDELERHGFRKGKTGG